MRSGRDGRGRQATIATDILARYAADAAREVEGVRALAGRRGVRVSGKGASRIELHVVADAGDLHSGVGRAVQAPRRASTSASMADVEPASVDVVVDAIENDAAHHRADGATLETAPSVCHECIWWQTRGGEERRQAQVDSRSTEDEWGAWGTVYHDDGRPLCSARCSTGRPSSSRARSELPAGPASADAVLVTCAYLTDPSRPWVMQSLFLTAIGDVRDRGARALEAFAYRYPEGETSYERFRAHQTIFPPTSSPTSASWSCARPGRVELARLELGGLAAGRGGRAREGAAGRAGSVRRARAGAVAAALLSARPDERGSAI